MLTSKSSSTSAKDQIISNLFFSGSVGFDGFDGLEGFSGFFMFSSLTTSLILFTTSWGITESPPTNPTSVLSFLIDFIWSIAFLVSCESLVWVKINWEAVLPANAEATKASA